MFWGQLRACVCAECFKLKFITMLSEQIDSGRNWGSQRSNQLGRWPSWGLHAGSEPSLQTVAPAGSPSSARHFRSCVVHARGQLLVLSQRKYCLQIDLMLSTGRSGRTRGPLFGLEVSNKAVSSLCPVRCSRECQQEVLTCNTTCDWPAAVTGLVA